MELKGYYTSSGYMGYVDGKWFLFETENEYVNYMREKEEENEEIDD